MIVYLLLLGFLGLAYYFYVNSHSHVHGEHCNHGASAPDTSLNKK